MNIDACDCKVQEFHRIVSFDDKEFNTSQYNLYSPENEEEETIFDIPLNKIEDEYLKLL